MADISQLIDEYRWAQDPNTNPNPIDRWTSGSRKEQAFKRLADALIERELEDFTYQVAAATLKR